MKKTSTSLTKILTSLLIVASLLFINTTGTDFDEGLTMNFSAENISDVTNPYVGKTGLAQINWSASNLNLTGYDLNADIEISQNHVYVDTAAMPNLNTTATITFFNLGYQATPIILTRQLNSSGTWNECAACTKTYNPATERLVFDIASFSAYSTGNNSALSTDFVGLQMVNQTITFWANYTNITSGLLINGATCILNTQSTDYAMSYDAGDDRYEYDHSFTTPSNYNYKINCTASGYEPLENNDNISIVDIPRLPLPFIKYFNLSTNNAAVTNILGYGASNNITLRVYTYTDTGDPDFVSAFTQSFYPYVNITTYGSSTVQTLPSNTSRINVPYNVALFGAAQGRYLYFDDYQKSDLTGYNITQVLDQTTYYTLILDSPRPATLQVSDAFNLTNSSTPPAWFNVTLNLAYNGTNKIGVRVNNSLTQSVSSTYAEVFLDQSPPFVNLTDLPPYYFSEGPVINFNVYDNYGVNLTTLIVNITSASYNESFSYDYAYYAADQNITCSGPQINSSCSINTSLVEEFYDVTFYVYDVFGNLNIQTSNITIYSTLETVSNITDGGTETNSTTLYFTWSNSSNPAFSFYEYAIGNDKHDVPGQWNNVVFLENTMNNYTTETIPLQVDTMYFISVRIVYQDGSKGPWSSSDGIMYVDLTPPVCSNCITISGDASLRPTQWTNQKEIYLELDFTEPESSIIAYDYEIGTNTCYLTGHDSLRNKARVAYNNPIAYNLPMIENISYYVNAWAENSEIIKESLSDCYSSIPIKYDGTPPYGGYINYSGAVYENISSTIRNVSIRYASGYDDLSGININKVELLMSWSPINVITGNCGAYTSFDPYRNLSHSPNGSSTLVGLSDGRCYRFKLRTWDNAGNYVEYPSTSNIISIRVDSTPPSSVIASDYGAWTTSKSLSAEWSESIDLESGIDYYVYRLRDNTTTIVDWTQTEYLQVTEYDLPLQNAVEYYFDVYAVNHLNLTSNLSSTNGIYYFDVDPPASIQITSVDNWTTPILGYYYDSTQTNTTIYFSGSETGLNCVYSPYDVNYKTPNAADGEGFCQAVSGTNYECEINLTEEGYYTYYVVCADSSGNEQTSEQNVDVSFVKAHNAPIINTPTGKTSDDYYLYINNTILAYGKNITLISLNNNYITVLVNQTTITLLKGVSSLFEGVYLSNVHPFIIEGFDNLSKAFVYIKNESVTLPDNYYAPSSQVVFSDYYNTLMFSKTPLLLSFSVTQYSPSVITKYQARDSNNDLVQNQSIFYDYIDNNTIYYSINYDPGYSFDTHTVTINSTDYFNKSAQEIINITIYEYSPEIVSVSAPNKTQSDFNISINTTDSFVLAYQLVDELGVVAWFNQTLNSSNVSQLTQNLQNTIDVSSLSDGAYTLKVIAANEFFEYDSYEQIILLDRSNPELFYLRPLFSDELRVSQGDTFTYNTRFVEILDINQTHIEVLVDLQPKSISVGSSASYYAASNNDVIIKLNNISFVQANTTLTSAVIQVYNSTTPALSYPQRSGGVYMYNSSITVFEDMGFFTFLLGDLTPKTVSYAVKNATNTFLNNTEDVEGYLTPYYTVYFINNTLEYESLEIEFNLTDESNNSASIIVPFYYDTSTPSIDSASILAQIPSITPGVFNLTINTSFVWFLEVNITNSTGGVAQYYEINNTPEEKYINNVSLINISSAGDGDYSIIITYSDLYGGGSYFGKSFVLDTTPPSVENLTIPDYLFTDYFEIIFGIGEANAYDKIWVVEETPINTTTHNFTSKYDNYVGYGATMYFVSNFASPNNQSNITIYANDTAGNIGSLSFNYVPRNRAPWFGRNKKVVTSHNYADLDSQAIRYDNDKLIVSYVVDNVNYSTEGFESRLSVYNLTTNSLVYSLYSNNKSFYLDSSIKDDIISYTILNYTINNTEVLTDYYGIIYYNLTNSSMVAEYSPTLNNWSLLSTVYNDNNEKIYEVSNQSNEFLVYYNITNQVILPQNLTYLYSAKIVNGVIYAYHFNFSGGLYDYYLIKHNLSSNTYTNTPLFSNTIISYLVFDENAEFVYYDNLSVYQYNLSSNQSTKLNIDDLSNPKITSSFFLDYLSGSAYYYDLSEHYPVLIETSFSSIYDLIPSGVVWLDELGIYTKEFAPTGLDEINDLTILLNDSYSFDIFPYISDYDDNEILELDFYLFGPNLTLTWNNSIVNITPATDYFGDTWVIFNVTDSGGETALSNNVSVSVIDSSTNNVSINSSVNLIFDFYNLSDGSLHSTQINPTSIILPNQTNFSMRITPQATSYEFGTERFNILDFSYLNVSFFDINVVTVDYDAIRLGSNTSVLYEGDRYEVLDAVGVEILSDFSGQYYVQLNYSAYEAMINNSGDLIIFEFGYNFSNNQIDYTDMTTHTSFTINTSAKTIYLVVNAFSAFVLAEDQADSEVCGNGVDEDYSGSDQQCSPQNPPSRSSTSSSSSRSEEPIIGRIETCTDGVRNQDEEGIDCGGSCPFRCPATSTSPTTPIVPPPVVPPPPPTTQPTQPGETGAGQENLWQTILSFAKNPWVLIGGGITALVLIIAGAILLVVFVRKKKHEEKKPKKDDDELTPDELIRQSVAQRVPIQTPTPVVPVPEVSVAMSTPKQISDLEHLNEDPLKERKIQLEGIEKEKIGFSEQELEPVVKYLNETHQKGVPISKVKEMLKEKGWPADLVEEALKRKSCRDNLKVLAEYIKKAKATGLSNDTIKHHLINAKWAEHFVEMVLHEVHEVHDDVEKVKNYVTNMISKGVEHTHIRDLLVQAGWDGGVIDPVIAEA
ncbi:hypothetical protein GOV05_02295 [Candidatus Woesearchaeota archaeon]|nr:hypothetical protein [Candidatus Woesearchaeota archaeon]